MSKRALSPLLAMVLLIAFIAAILAMAVSWTLTHTFGRCTEVSVRIPEEPTFAACATDTELRFALLNEGQDLTGIEVTAVSDTENLTTLLPGAQLQGAVTEHVVPLPQGIFQELRITPVLDRPCSGRTIIARNLRKC